MPKGLRQPALERFLAFIEITDDCWLWMGARQPTGYGVFRVNGKSVRVHRWSYENFVGPIPDDLVIDHLCRVRHCVRPEHLEVVTRAENLHRVVHEIKAHCKNGHPLGEGDYYCYPPKNQRMCKRCRADLQRQYRARKRLTA